MLAKKQIKNILLLRFKKLKNKHRYLHYTFGAWTIIFNFIMGWSGLYLTIPILAGEVTNRAPDTTVSDKNNHEITISLDKYYAKALAQFPNFKLRYLKLPRGQNDSTVCY